MSRKQRTYKVIQEVLDEFGMLGDKVIIAIDDHGVRPRNHGVRPGIRV